MQPNYSELMRKQQEDYQRSRNPFEFGQQVARRRYSQIMSGLDAQRQATQRSYGDMYQAARQRAVGQQAMGGPTLSGGMGQQRRDFVSALEMQELGKIGQARQQAEADLFAQSQSAFSNAQLEGQQAAQQEVANRTAQLQMVQQRQAIMADKNLTPEQKQEQIDALGPVSAGTGVSEAQQRNANISGQILGTTGTVAAGLYGTKQIVKGTKAGYTGIKAAGTLVKSLGAKGLGTVVTNKTIAKGGTALGKALFTAAKAKGVATTGLTAKAAIAKLGFKGVVGLKVAGAKLGVMKGLGLLAVANPVGAVVVGVLGVAALVGVGFALFGK